MYDKLKEHIGHNIVCVGYGAREPWQNVAVECEDCSVVLVDADKDDV